MSYTKIYRANHFKKHQQTVCKNAVDLACVYNHSYVVGVVRPLSKKNFQSDEKINSWYENTKKNTPAKYRNRKYIIQENLVNASVEDQFISLTKRWKKETMMSSLAAEKIKNLNYQTIIGLGVTFKEKIIHLILKDLEGNIEYWHYALKSITGFNPVPKGMVNNLVIVRNYWLNWGKENKKI